MEAASRDTDSELMGWGATWGLAGPGSQELGRGCPGAEAPLDAGGGVPEPVLRGGEGTEALGTNPWSGIAVMPG